jgi:hypothetical protein
MSKRFILHKDSVTPRIDFFKFANLRSELGQKKYGRGRKNAGWRRDNARDVMEELHDAIVITCYWKKRVAMVKDKELLDDIIHLESKLWGLLETVEAMRSRTPEKLIKEKNVTRFPPTKEVAYHS